MKGGKLKKILAKASDYKAPKAEKGPMKNPLAVKKGKRHA